MKKLFIFLLLGMFLLSFTSAFDWNDGTIVSYFKNDETTGSLFDQKYLNNLSVTGNPLYSQTGIINTAIGFDSNTDYFNKTNSVGVDFTATQDFSVSLWVYALGWENDRPLVSTNPAGTFGYWRMNPEDNTGVMGFEIANNSGGGNANRQIVTSGPMSNNSWHHIVGTRNGSGTTINIYVDGVLQGTAVGSARAISGKNLLFGDMRGDRYFNGRLDEIGIWNKTLSASEITELYNSGNGLAYGGGSGTSNFAVNLIYPPFGSLLTATGSLFNATYNISGTNYSYHWVNATYILYNTTGLFNQTTVSLTGNTTTSSLFIDSFIIGDYNWSVNACYTNTTITNCTSSSNYTYTVGAEIQNLSYYTDVYETQNQRINATLNLVPGTELYDVKIVHNGTEHQGTFTDTGNDTFLVYATFDTNKLPSATSSNMSFYFRLIYSVGINTFLYENTTSTNQMVSPISLADCAVTTNQTLNFTALNEENLTSLSPFNFLATFEYWLGTGDVRKNVSINNLNVNYSALCLNPAGNLTYKTTAIIQYEKEGFVKRNYYFYNASLTNVTQNINLYLLSTLQSTSFIVSVKDASQLAVQGAYIYSQRYYPGTGNFETVAMGLTDNNGNTVLHFEDETEDYRIIVMKDGVVIYTSPTQKIYCAATPCTLPIQTGVGGVDGWSKVGNLSNLIYTGPYYDNTTNQIIYTYIDTSGSTSYGRLLVYQYKNAAKQVICDTNSTSNAATLTCDVSGVTGTIIAEAFISRSPEVLVWAASFVINSIKAIMGMEGLFWATIIVMILAIAGGLMGGPSGGIVGVVVGMWGVQMLQVASFGLITTWGVTLLGIFLLWNLRN